MLLTTLRLKQMEFIMVLQKLLVFIAIVKQRKTLMSLFMVATSLIRNGFSADIVRRTKKLPVIP